MEGFQRSCSRPDVTNGSLPALGLFRLDGQAAVVTGALGKLGPVWMEGLASAGGRVVGLDLEGAAVPPCVAGLVERYGPDSITVLRADVLDRKSLEGVLARCTERVGIPTVLVNNAGIDQPPREVGRTYRIEEMPLELWRPVLEVNLLGAFQAAQVFGRGMLEVGRGSIVNVGSLYASVAPDSRFYDHLECDPPFLKPPAYGASKAALVNLTRYLATLWARHGVRVNALSPGGVVGGQDEDFHRKYSARVPLGRMAMAEDLIGPLLFLASEASRYITGIDLVVDGGFTAW